MPAQRPSLDEIFAEPVARPSLDEIFAEPAPEESGIMDELGRQIGRTGRMAVSGAASVLDTPRIVTDPLYTAGYYGAKALGADDAKEFFRQELARPTFGEMAKEKVDEVTGDAFAPRNTTEKVTDFIGDVGFSVIAGDKGAKAFKKVATAPIWDDVTSGGKKAVDLTKKIAEKRALSSAKYEEALASKEVFPADFSESMVRKTDDFIPVTEFEADLTKGSPSLEVANLLQKYRGKPLTIRDIDTLDKKLTNRAFALWSTEPDEARKISEIQDALRESLEGYNAGGKLAEGRDLFKQQSVLRDLLKMRESAAMTKNSQSAMATAAKNYLLNPKRAARLTDTEKELMQKVAKTGLGTDLANAIGSRLNTIALGAATGNPAVATGAFLAGAAGRKAASGLQNKKLDTLIDAIEARPIGQGTGKRISSPLSREEIQAMTAANASRINPDSVSGLSEPQKLLPAPAIRLPDEVGKPTLDTMIPKQKLLPAPALENVTTKTGQVRPQTSAERDAAIAARMKYKEIGRMEALRAKEPPIQNFPDPRTPPVKEIPDSPEKALMDEATYIRKSLDNEFTGDIEKEAVKRLGYQPLSLSKFVAQRGGLTKVGELSDAGINQRSLVGLMRGKGRSIDYIKQDAFERGYFPNAQSADDISNSAFYEAIVNDLQKSKVYPFEDLLKLNEIKQSLSSDETLAQMGLYKGMTTKEIADRLRDLDGGKPLAEIRPNLKTKIKKKD